MRFRNSRFLNSPICRGFWVPPYIMSRKRQILHIINSVFAQFHSQFVIQHRHTFCHGQSYQHLDLPDFQLWGLIFSSKKGFLECQFEYQKEFEIPVQSNYYSMEYNGISNFMMGFWTLKLKISEPLLMFVKILCF